MAGWREHKAKARAAIHATFEIPAVYVPSLVAGIPRRVNVKNHSKVAALENEFTWPATSAMLSITPKLIFKADELPKIRALSLVVFSPTEMYRMGASEPAREGFYACECTLLTAEECAATLDALGAVSGAVWEGVLP